MSLRSIGGASISAIALTTALVSQPAMAQDSDTTTEAEQDEGERTGLKEIVVTARKVGESEQTLPISIAAFGAEEIETQTVQNVNDLQRIAPGLSISANSQGNAPLFAIRGTATENKIDGGIAVYFDDVPLSTPIAITNAFYDISSVEILKGPQGTQFGRNTTGGTISIRAQKPTDNFEGYVKAGYGNYDRKELEGAINLPVNDILKFRFAGNYVNRDGFIKNPANAGVREPEMWTEDHYSLRGSMRMEGADITSDLVVDYYKQDDIPNTAIAIAFGAPAGVPALSPENFGAELGSPGVVNIGPDISGVNRKHYQKAEIYGFQHVLNWDLSDTFAVRNVFGYHRSALETSQNSAGYTLSSISVTTQEKYDNWVDDFTLRYTSPDSKFQLSVGAYYSTEKKETGVVANAIQTLLPVFAPDLLAFFPYEDLVTYTSNIRIKWYRNNDSKALYANSDYDVTDQINVFGGVRYNWDKTNLRYSQAQGVGLPDIGTNFLPDLYNPCATSALIIYQDINYDTCWGRSEADFKEWSWNFGVNFTISPDVLTYAKVSRGYLAGGINDNLREVPIYDPEINTQYEVGVKADWYLGDRPIRTNVALYLSKLKNKQIVQNTNYDDGASANGVLNAAKETVKGIDAEFQFSPFDGLTLDASYSFIDAKFDDFQFPALGGPVFTLQPGLDLTGNTPARVPKHQLNLAATADLVSDADMGDISATVSGYYTSKILARNVDNTGPYGPGFITMESYWLANASLNWRNIAGTPISANLWIKNIFDKDYAILKDAQFFVFGYANAYYGEPRTYGLTARVDF